MDAQVRNPSTKLSDVRPPVLGGTVRQSEPPIDLSTLHGPKGGEALVGRDLMSTKVVCALRDLIQSFYVELELFVDEFSRGPIEFGLRAKHKPAATVSHLDDRCSEIIHATFPLVLKLAFSEREAAVKGVAAGVKAIAQGFRLSLRQDTFGGQVGEDSLPMVVSKCIDAQQMLAEPLDQVSAIAFAMQAAEMKGRSPKGGRDAA